ncbi:MAG TPA: histidine phosphatase family protein [Pseudolabrys sp.]|jgi:broad specificity phosphatase PhoE
MPPPTIYYIRHGETDWNVAGRLQGRHDVPLNARGRAQADHCGKILRDLLADNGHDPAELDYVSSPLGRACETMELVRPPLGLPANGYRLEQRLAEISFGEWEGFTIAQLHSRDPQRIAAREHDKWHFVPPGGESYKIVSDRVGAWYDSLTRDTVAVAHGGTARGLMAHLEIAKPAAAPLVDIAQGVVYVFEGERLTRHT